MDIAACVQLKKLLRPGLDMQEDDPNAAAAALEASFPDTTRKNKNKKKGGSAAAALPSLVEAGKFLLVRINAHNTSYSHLCLHLGHVCAVTVVACQCEGLDVP